MQSFDIERLNAFRRTLLTQLAILYSSNGFTVTIAPHRPA